MNPAPPSQCDVRKCIQSLFGKLESGPKVVVDPRVPEYLPCEEAILLTALRELFAKFEEFLQAKTLVVYEPDADLRRTLRFEVPGTSIVMDFPIPSASSTSVPGHTGELSILVAEDNAINQHVATECLQVLGYSCDIANDGAEAVEAAGKRPYDLIFMDIHMPVMDGLEATRRIRALPEGRKPFIAALTAYALLGDKARSVDAGMDDYVTKPCRIETLAEVIRKVTARKI